MNDAIVTVFCFHVASSTSDESTNPGGAQRSHPNSFEIDYSNPPSSGELLMQVVQGMTASLNPFVVTVMSALHLPHIPEYLSVSSSGATEDVSDNCKEGEMLDFM